MDRAQRSRFTLVAMSLGFAVVQLDVSVVNVAIRPIGEALGGGIVALQWIVSAYTIAFAAFILSAGALGDRVGARRVFVGGFALFTVASAACGLAPSLGALVAARTVQGLGAAILVPCSLILLNHAFPEPADRSRAVGLWAAGASVALSGGPLAGGALIAMLGWRAIFFINVPIGLVGIWLTLRFAPETPRARDRGIDVPGQSAAVLALATLAAATIAGGEGGWDRPGVLLGYALAAVAFAAFLLREARSARPMLPLGLFRDRTFSSAAAIGLLLNIAFYGLIFVLSLFFQRDQGRSALETGLAFAPMTGIVMATNVAAGRIARVVGPRRVMIFGAVLAAAACALLLGVGRATPYWEMAVQLTVLGGAVGLMVPLMTSELLGSVDRSRSGIASGTLNTMRQTGSVIGVALFGSVVASSVAGVAAGLHAVLGISIALLLATGGLALGMAGRPASQGRFAPRAAGHGRRHGARTRGRLP
jgi:DHA2 family methylenomycin A resistance protein-like MFS transporter